MSTSEPGPEFYINTLQLEPHAEGGWHRRTWRQPDGTERGAASAIYYLLEPGQKSHWHRIDCAEMWLWHAGSPLIIQTWAGDDALVETRQISIEEPQFLIKPNLWQTARPVSGWTLVTCVVSPGFAVAGWELAPAGWTPSGKA